MEMTVLLAGYVAQLRIRAKYTNVARGERDEPDHLMKRSYIAIYSEERKQYQHHLYK